MTTHVFASKYGNLKVSPVDMDAVYEIVEDYKQRFPPPAPPMKPPDWNFSLARQANALVEKGYTRQAAREKILAEAPLAPDEKDTEYVTAMRLYHVLAYHVMEKVMVERGVQAQEGGNTTLRQILLDESERIKLFHFIRDASELTEAVVLRAIDKLGFTWKSRPLYEAKNVLPAGSSGGTWAAWGKIAATQSGISPVQYKEMSVSDQAELLACWMATNWFESLSIKDSQEKNETRRVANLQNRGRR